MKEAQSQASFWGDRELNSKAPEKGALSEIRDWISQKRCSFLIAQR